MLTRQHLARRWLLCLVLVALVIHGASGVLVQMLGSSHRHNGVIPATQVIDPSTLIRDGIVASGLHAIGDWMDRQRPQSSVTALFEHAHQHGLLERHHHDADDPTVIAIGESEAGVESAAGTSTGSATMPMALAAPLRLPLTVESVQRWAPQGLMPWRDACARLPFRPPRG